MRGEDPKIKIPLKVGYYRPASERHLNGVRWRANGDPTLNAGLVACDSSGDPDQYC